MPQYLLGTGPVDAARFAAAIALLSRRYPEITLEHRYVGRDGATEVWVCRAPSAAHVERWCAEAGLDTHGASSVDDETAGLPRVTHRPC